jgi:cytochrome oxidase Cu insertion factor (SCO1/SenC/PrrC family)
MISSVVRASVALAIMCGTPALAGVPHDVRDVPLVDQRGATFTLRGLERPTAVIFVASRCGDACPIAEALFARLDEMLRRAHLDARLLTVTLEPD